MHRSKLSAAAVLPIFTKAICGKTLSLGMSEKKTFLYMKNLSCSWMNKDKELETYKCSMESLLWCCSPC